MGSRTTQLEGASRAVFVSPTAADGHQGVRIPCRQTWTELICACLGASWRHDERRELMAPHLQRDSTCVGQVRDDHQQEGMTRIIVRRLLAVPGVHRILDVGCGDGYAMELFQAAGKECVGVTLNAAGVDACLKRGLSAVRGDAHDLDSIFCREFDLVYCRQSVEHFYSPFLALVAMNRVLRYDKFLFVSLPDESWIEADDHLYVLNFRQMTTLLHKTGFRPVLLWEDRYMALVDRCFLARKVREP